MKLLYLEQCTSTNRWAKENRQALAPQGAVYTMNQTGGRGRLGRRWENTPNQALYYTALLQMDPVQPETLPQLASLAAVQAVQSCFGVQCRIKWPNDLLLNGRKVAGILCESTDAPEGRVWIVGIGINLTQSRAQMEALGLPYGSSLAAEGVPVNAGADAPALARALNQSLAGLCADFARAGFGPFRPAYKALCVNLGRRVFWQQGGAQASGICADIDSGGRLVVETGAGETAVFTGEVSVTGIYGTL